MIDCVVNFIADVRRIYETVHELEPRWRAMQERTGSLLMEESLRQHTRSWPETVSDGTTERITVGNLIFYEDADHGFTLNGAIRQPGLKSNIHCHGPAWTLYGLIEGAESIERYQREPGLSLTHVVEAKPGTVDLVRPGEIHREVNGPERSVAFIVRSARSGTFTQHRYLPDGSVTSNRGPKLIPYELA